MTSTMKRTPTLKDYLTQDMSDDPTRWYDMLYADWDKFYKVDPFRPIYGYPGNLITYPYTIPYKDS